MKTTKTIWLLLLCHSLTAQTIETNFATNGILVVEGYEYLDGTIQSNRFIFKDDDWGLKGFTLNGVEDFNFGNSGAISPYEAIVPDFWGSVGAVKSNSQYSVQAQSGYFSSTPNVNKLIVGLYDTDGQMNDTVEFSANGVSNWNIPAISFSGDEAKTFICMAEISTSPPALCDSLCIFSVNQNGTPNSAWGTNGRSILNLAPIITGLQGYSDILSIYHTNNGVYIALRIFQSGNDYSAVIKTNVNGTIDTNFGVKNLPQIINSPTNLADIAYTSDAVYLLTYSNKIYKLNLSDFSLDTGFGTNGKIVPTEPNGEYYHLRIIDGMLYGIGRVVASNHYKPLLSRFNATSGATDNTFGVNGSLLFTDPQFLDEYNFRDVLPYNANSFFVIGDSYLDSGSGSGNYHDMFVVKYNQTPTGISNIEANSFQIYPNPVTEKVFIGSSGIYSAKIISSQGAVVGTIYNATESTLDFSPFAPGLYFIELQTSKGSTTYKIIKQ